MRTKGQIISGSSTRQIIIALAIIGIFTIGLILRVVMTAETKVSIPIRADAKDYYLYAHNMIEYGVYSRQAPGKFKGPKPVADAHRAPGYPLFLVPFVKFPPTFKMVNSIVVTQAIISALTILAAIACFKSFLSWPWTFGAALLTAISPHLIAFNIYLLTECLFTLSLVLLTLAMVRLSRSRNRLYAVIVGLATGVSFLIRPTMLYFIVFLVPGFLFFLKRKKVRRWHCFWSLVFVRSGDRGPCATSWSNPGKAPWRFKPSTRGCIRISRITTIPELTGSPIISIQPGTSCGT